ncbi:carbohydrate ABC transporter permease [Jiangella sp. DSM 45060]|uniref:carbohydrate ABC transporter permease n=1 Tax=Jiangella sp. DSM 45060 TaxID=1798224 RepID=UPI00087929DB|nr:sugar ABC transporter permease [Jiangella sp. DSM 45060]SDT17606.1 carbohydrate ABC transporter membrane protein 1, CUT1 family [Jiangella sp. DSM 45060]
MAVIAPRVRALGRSGVSDRQLAFLLATPAAVLLAVFVVYPFAMALLNSFADVDAASGRRTFIGIDNFVTIASDPGLRAAFGRTVVWTVSNMALQVCLGVLVALLLNARLRGQGLARGLVLFPYMVPAIVVALMFRYMFNDVTGLANYVLLDLGLIDAPLGWLSDPDVIMVTLVLVNVWKYTPFFVIVVLARLQTISRELYEAVSIDGGGRWAAFRAVTLPSIMPVLLVAMLLRTIWTAYDFDIPYLLSAGGGPGGSAVTVPLAIRSLAFESGSIGQASALAVCMALLLIASAWVYLRGFDERTRT